MKRALATALAFSVFTLGSSQNNLSVSGTVFALPGSNLENTAVIACLLVNDTCDTQHSGLQQLNAKTTSSRFQIANLENQDYLLLAWRDLNGNGEADAGDEVGVYQQGGKPAMLRPPANNLELRLARFAGDLDSLINQAEQPAAAASSGLSLSGRVRPQAGSSLDGTQVFACVLATDWCDDAKTKGVNLNADGTFSIAGLERIPYLLFAWRDTDGDGSVSAADEIGVYATNGKPAKVAPPQSNLALTLKVGGLTDLEALRGNASPTVSTNTNANTSGNAVITNSPLRFTFSSVWRNTGNGSYEAIFGEESYTQRKGLIRVQVYPPLAKSGALLAQTRAVWQKESKGQYDQQGASGGLYVRRSQGGLNVGVTFGTLRKIENPNQEDRYNSILAVYTVMFLVEHGNQVTPIFFILTRPNSSSDIYTTETEGRGLMLEVMNTLKPKTNVAVSPLYTEANFIGKWKATSGSSLNTNWYSPSTGAYVTSTFAASSFGQLMTFSKGGTGTYSQSLATSNNSGTTFQNQKGKIRWQLSGDFLALEMIDQGFKQYYQLYGIGKDDRGRPVILARFLYNGNAQTRDDLDGTPDKLWLVDE